MHTYYAKLYPNRKVYNIFNELGCDNVKIELIEEYFLENHDQLLQEEDRVIQRYIHDDRCLNTNRAWTYLEKR